MRDSRGALDRLAVEVSTVWVVGRTPKMPGTMGTAFAALMVYLGGGTGDGLLALALAISIIGVWSSARAERVMGRTDPGSIVIDEVAGYMIGVLYLPFNLWYLLAGFALFRFFDIIKPWPIGRLQRLPRGWGVMIDDLAAGVATNAVMRIWHIQQWM